MWGSIIGGAISLAGSLFGAAEQEAAFEHLTKAFGYEEESIREKEAARREEFRMEKLKLGRQRRQIAREARLARGEALQAGANSGAAVESSSIAGGIGGAESTAAASQAFLSQTERGVENINEFLGRSAEASAMATRERGEAAASGELAKLYGAAGEALGGDGKKKGGLIKGIFDFF